MGRPTAVSRAPCTLFPGLPLSGNELDLETLDPDVQTRFVIVDTGAIDLGL